MAVDGVRSEPAALALARRIPGPRVARVSLPWATLAAFGGGLFASAIGLSLASLLLLLTGTSARAPLFDLATAISMGVAVAVAWAAGGRTAVTAYVAILVFERLLGLPAILSFCGRNPEFCSLLEYLANLWPVVLGLALGYALVRWVGWVRGREGDRNELLEAAGALALTQGVLVRVVGASATASAFVNELSLLIVAIVAGLACAAVLLRRVDPSRRWRVLGVVALAVIVPWLLVSVPVFLETVGIGRGLAISGLALVGFAAPLIEIGVAALMLYMAAARAVASQP